jgi:hypothetical protein
VVVLVIAAPIFNWASLFRAALAHRPIAARRNCDRFLLFGLQKSPDRLCLAGPASRSMARAMIASPYIRQLRSGLP